MTANKFANRAVKAVLPFSPVVGMVSTCLLVAAADYEKALEDAKKIDELDRNYPGI